MERRGDESEQRGKGGDHWSEARCKGLGRLGSSEGNGPLDGEGNGGRDEINFGSEV